VRVRVVDWAHDERMRLKLAIPAGLIELNHFKSLRARLGNSTAIVSLRGIWRMPNLQRAGAGSDSSSIGDPCPDPLF
jgi:hypothetical protein